MDRRIVPARNIVGGVRLPGDKGISHRYALLGAMADGETAIRDYAPGADCGSTLRCLEALGVGISRRQAVAPTGEPYEQLVIAGRGLGGFQPPAAMLDAGNSGSTMRMLSGLLAGHAFRSVITGDESLQRRPMRRVMEPLARMGARLEARDGDFPPLVIHGGGLRGIEYALPVPSAQVKSAVLLAGLLAEGKTTVIEPAALRDHTEIALQQFGAEVSRGRRRATVCGGQRLQAQDLEVPGDISSAAFFLCAALLFPESNLLLQSVGLNPTRTAFVDFLAGMGAKIKMLNIGPAAGELVGDIHVSGGPLKGGRLEGEQVAGLIDEIPVLAVLGTQTAEGFTVRDARELRIKETDRIATIAENLRRMGARVEVFDDGLQVPGQQALSGAELDSFGDHRIAMALAVAALVAKGDTLVRHSDAAVVSFPQFFEDLGKITER